MWCCKCHYFYYQLLILVVYLGTPCAAQVFCDPGEYCTWFVPLVACTIKKDCPAGTFQPSYYSNYLPQPSQCDNCPVGKYSGIKAASCTNCNFNTYQDQTGQTGCKNCPAGTETITTGLTSCYYCTVGTYGPGDGLGCWGCPAGKYQQATGQTFCHACPTGKVSGNLGAGSCYNCNPGFYPVDSNYNAVSSGAVACASCAAGKTSTPGTTVCYNCAGGYYSPGGSDCIGCAAGKYSSVGASICSACSAGSYSSAAGSSSCTSCPRGTYSSIAGATSCTSCSAGKYSSAVGAASATTCTNCSAGNYSSVAGATNSSWCTVCAPGKYASAPGSTVCTNCREACTPLTWHETSPCTLFQNRVCRQCDAIHPMDLKLGLAAYTSQGCGWKCTVPGYTKSSGERCVPCYPHPAEGFVFTDECAAACDTSLYDEYPPGVPAQESTPCDPLKSPCTLNECGSTSGTTQGCQSSFSLGAECQHIGYYLARSVI